MDQYFSKDDILMVPKHVKRCSVSFIIGEIQIKNKKRHQFTPTKIAVMKKTVTGVGNDMEKLECSYIAELLMNS